MECDSGRSSPRRRRLRVCVAAVAVAGLSVVPTAHADQHGFGLRGGVSADPDQFVVGIQYDTGPLFDRLTFRPNADIGFGDDLTLVSLNFEVAYWIPLKGKPWSFFVGGGPAMNLYNFEGEGRGPEGDDTDVEPGFNIMFGVAHADGLFFELKVGAIDSPDFKAIVGYSFGR